MTENGDTAPSRESLEKLLGQIKGMAHEAKRSQRKRRNRVYVSGQSAPKLPRRYCDICGLLYDFCLQTSPVPPTKSRCGDCINMLVSGYVAFIGRNALAPNAVHAWVKPGPACNLKPGQVYTVTDEQMEVVRQRFKEQKNQ